MKLIKRFISDSNASIVPVLLFILTIIGVGALYTLLFIEVGLPTFKGYVPASDSKTFILMCIYGMPLIIFIVGIISLLKAGLKREVY